MTGWKIPQNLGYWTFAPLISMVAFFSIFSYYAERLELNEFEWSLVATNVQRTLTNQPPPSVAETLISAERQTLIIPQGATRQTVSGNTNDIAVGLIGKLAVKKETPKPDRLTRGLTVRMFWGIAAVVFAFLCLAVVYQAIRIINTVFQLQWYWVTAVALIAVFGFFKFYHLAKGEVSPIAGGKAGEQLFTAMEDKENLKTPLRDQNFLGKIPNVRKLVAVLTAASKVGLFAVAIAA